MDGNYDIRAIAVSLKTRCAVKVVQQVLLASRINGMEPGMKKLAKRLVRELELPRELIEMLENLIRPMKKEMILWLTPFGQFADPILTPVGSIDELKSANALLLSGKMNKVTSLHVACYNCAEDHISKLFKELTAKELDNIHAKFTASGQVSFPYFWKQVFLGLFGSVTPDGHLPQEACDEGFELALRTKNDIAIWHFINKASTELVSSWITCWSFWPQDHLSPATICLLFSKLSMTDQRAFMPYEAYVLLHKLLHFPYQFLFMEAAHTLTSHLTEEYYLNLVSDLVLLISYNEKDFNYRTLFHQLWLEGSCYRHGSITSEFFGIIIGMVEYLDASLINFVLAETSIEWKEALLMDFDICTELVSFKEFKLLELFIRGCRACNRDVLLAFKLRFTAFVEDFNGTVCNWGSDLSQFANIMDEIIAEKPESEEMAH